MDLLDDPLRLLIERSRGKLIRWCCENYPLLGADYAANNPYAVGMFYGLSRLEQEEKTCMELLDKKQLGEALIAGRRSNAVGSA